MNAICLLLLLLLLETCKDDHASYSSCHNTEQNYIVTLHSSYDINVNIYIYVNTLLMLSCKGALIVIESAINANITL